jgi:hypothetical protein
MNIIYSTILIISAIFSSINAIPISTELGPVVVKQNKPIIYSPENETIVYKKKPVPSKDDITLSDYIVIDGIVIYTPKDITPFIV